MAVEVASLLHDLVSLPSINPMGSPVTGPPYGESQVTDYLASYFSRLDLPHVRIDVEPSRENILARLDGDPNRLLVFEVHQDTVPVEGMTIDPFGGETRDGKLYGRGACDVKGSMAAMLSALARLRREPAGDRPTLVLACTVNEEYGFSGAEGLASLWTGERHEFFHRTPDAVVVAEPTELDVVVAHKGIVRWRCGTHGVAAHTSRPELGDNAIYKMARAVTAIERYTGEVLPELGEHRLCGRPTLVVSTISGGVSINMVPARATIEIDRRLIPGEEPETAREHVIDYLAEQVGEIEHEVPYRAIVGLSDENNGPLAEGFLASAQEVAPRSKIAGVPYGTDAAVLATTGVPCIVFGPGSIDQAHTADEWISLEQLGQAAEIYYRFASRPLN